MLENLVTAELRMIGRYLLVDKYSDLPRQELISSIKSKQKDLFKIIFVDRSTCKNFACDNCPIRWLCKILEKEIGFDHTTPDFKDILGLFLDFSRQPKSIADDENFKELSKKINALSETYIDK